MKRIISLVVAMILIFAMAAPAFATENASPVEDTRARGYTSGKVVIGGDPVDYTAYLTLSNSYGARSVINVENTTVGRKHLDISVTYKVSNYGNKSELGGYRELVGTGYTYSNYVPSRYGMSAVLSVVKMNTSIKIYGDSMVSADISI